jgi:hypothetical protein
MERYLIETPHNTQECKLLVDQIYAMGYLYHFDWGCPEGIHSGWAIIEADNEADARLAVPPIVRNKARVVKLTKFTGESKLFHDSMREPGRMEKSQNAG